MPTVQMPQRREFWPYLLIASVVTILVVAFAYAGGWLPRERLTASRLVDTLETGGAYPGFRRAHSRGFCIAGNFESNGAGARLSEAAILAAGRTNFIGRMSIGGGGPDAAEATARVRSMALQLVQPDGQEWRMAMNSFPVFVVATPEAFHEQIVISQPDPATGQPDTAKLAAFTATHPEGAAFRQWAQTAPFTDSLANSAFHGVHAFLFERDGQAHAVRWSMQPTLPLVEMDAATRAAAAPDYLEQELKRRLAEGPVRWNMVVIVAASDDPTDDPTHAWPEDRERIVVGDVVVHDTLPAGACRDINFDPLILPQGVRPSGDPVLHARSAVYSESVKRRLRETAAQSSASAAP